MAKNTETPMRFSIIREIWSDVQKKSVFEIEKVFECKYLEEASTILKEVRDKYPEDKVSLYVRLS